MKYLDIALVDKFNELLTGAGYVGWRVYAGHIPEDAFNNGKDGSPVVDTVLSFYHIATPIQGNYTLRGTGGMSEKIVQVSVFGETKQKTWDCFKVIADGMSGLKTTIGAGTSEPIFIQFCEDLGWQMSYDKESYKWHLIGDLKVFYTDN